MPVSNIVDYRTNKYNILCDVVIEASCHDNSIAGATHFEWTDEVGYSEALNTDIQTALEHCRKFKECVTLFLYDVGVV